MKKQSFILFLILILIIPSCSNKKNIPLAKNYSEQSKFEAEQDNIRQALQLVDKSIELENKPESLAYKVTLLYQLQDFKQCCALCKKIINDKKTPVTLKADTLNNYACSLLALGKEDKAQEIWQELTKNKNYLSPEVAWLNLGRLELLNAIRNKDQDVLFNEFIVKANKSLSKAVMLSSEYVDASYYLAITYIYLNNLQKAQNILEDILLFVPDHKLAQSLLSQVKIKIQEPVEK